MATGPRKCKETFAVMSVAKLQQQCKYVLHVSAESVPDRFQWRVYLIDFSGEGTL